MIAALGIQDPASQSVFAERLRWNARQLGIGHLWLFALTLAEFQSISFRLNAPFAMISSE
ncbi:MULTISPECIES: hypothetical protein [unclassified Bradyrhizobium]|uniref:hypothetical protein n=1 Tax=unclassified Bradyrhizobium TaxID=2631580 RepID=UPI001FF8814A|nr:MULTISPECIES: hypothetical protein [unclassified Bradyrhizobium]MCK1612392.1 hypothetical protein [Bradyrhizobium sp. 163]MCK1763910.1 hypothetical protein [Bradyrhizobium sp. 136]